MDIPSLKYLGADREPGQGEVVPVVEKLMYNSQNTANLKFPPKNCVGSLKKKELRS